MRPDTRDSRSIVQQVYVLLAVTAALFVGAGSFLFWQAQKSESLQDAIEAYHLRTIEECAGIKNSILSIEARAFELRASELTNPAIAAESRVRRSQLLAVADRVRTVENIQGEFDEARFERTTVDLAQIANRLPLGPTTGPWLDYASVKPTLNSLLIKASQLEQLHQSGLRRTQELLLGQQAVAFRNAIFVCLVFGTVGFLVAKRILSSISGVLEASHEAHEQLEHNRDHLEELVDERTRALEEVQESLLRKERLATLGQILATVSHELRNPLGTIATSVYTLEESIPEDDSYAARAMERINRSIKRCERIIEELLDYSRVGPAKTEPTELSGWIKSVLAEHDIPKAITVDADLDSNTEAQIDQEKMRRCFINLIQNAIQSMEGNGREPKVLTLTLRQLAAKNRVEIGVRDTGAGIENSEMGKLFEPLYSTKSFGVGLGLPIVKQIIELHGGGIEIDSEIKVGTEVKLWLPLNGSKGSEQ